MQLIGTKDKLWYYLQQLLNDPQRRYNHVINWQNLDKGIFKIVDPALLAQLWGVKKNHPTMNYDKLSRSLRYYYKEKKLRKVPRQRQVYQFLFSNLNRPHMDSKVAFCIDKFNKQNDVNLLSNFNPPYQAKQELDFIKQEKFDEDLDK